MTQDNTSVIEKSRLSYFNMLAQSVYTYVTTKDSLIAESAYHDVIYALKKLNYDLREKEK